MYLSQYTCFLLICKIKTKQERNLIVNHSKYIIPFHNPKTFIKYSQVYFLAYEIFITFALQTNTYNTMDKEREYFDIVEDIVSSYFDVSIEDMKMGNRKSNVTLARGYAMYILHRDLGLSISKIAKEFGRTTRAVFWHISKISSFMEFSHIYKKIYGCLRSSENMPTFVVS